jgi:RHS repeat-associated protein
VRFNPHRNLVDAAGQERVHERRNFQPSVLADTGRRNRELHGKLPDQLQLLLHAQGLAGQRAPHVRHQQSHVNSDAAFAPYGEIYDPFGSKGTAYQMFTGGTQDIVTGTMETPNREYNNSAQGRWLSPDPAGAGWNQYAYPANPNSFVDPTGLTAYLGPGGQGLIMPDHRCRVSGYDLRNPCASFDESSTCDVDGLDEPCSLVGPSSEVAALFALAGMQIPTQWQWISTVDQSYKMILDDGTVVPLDSSSTPGYWQLEVDDPILLAQGPPANNGPVDWVIDDYSLLRLKQNWWKWALGYGAKVGAVKALKPAASTVGYLGGLSTLMMLGSTMLDAVDTSKLPPPPDPTLQFQFNWVPGPNGTLVLEVPQPQ